MSDPILSEPRPNAALLANAFSLGIPVDDLLPVHGGLVHRMWKLRTTKGTFAITASAVDRGIDVAESVATLENVRAAYEHRPRWREWILALPD